MGGEGKSPAWAIFPLPFGIAGGSVYHLLRLLAYGKHREGPPSHRADWATRRGASGHGFLCDHAHFGRQRLCQDQNELRR